MSAATAEGYEAAHVATVIPQGEGHDPQVLPADYRFAMRLTPRYENPFLRLDFPEGDPTVPLIRQRDRFAAQLSVLDADAWQAESRCEGWAVRDVVSHLVTTNQFWTLSAQAALAGEPTRYLRDFDPVATPAQLVEESRTETAAEVLETFTASNHALGSALGGLDDAAWDLPAEAPPGHVPLRALALHALWDCWVHERDVVIPLGLEPVEEDDEVAGSLAYVAALSPAFAVVHGEQRRGVIAVDVINPDLSFVVEVDGSVRVRPGSAPAGALHLTGPAVELAEALSFRGPLPCTVDDESRWLLGGLAHVFDRVD